MPAACRYWGKKRVLSGTARWLSTTLCRCMYWPVRMVARLGEQSDVVTKAFAKCAPSLAMRSRFGVSRNSGPFGWKPRKSYRWSSLKMRTTFLNVGLAVAVCPSASSAAAARPSAWPRRAGEGNRVAVKCTRPAYRVGGAEKTRNDARCGFASVRAFRTLPPRALGFAIGCVGDRLFRLDSLAGGWIAHGLVEVHRDPNRD